MSKDGIVSAQAIFSVKWDGSKLEKKEFRGKSKVCQETGRTGVGSNSKPYKLWVFLLTSQHKLPSPATLSHPLKIFSLLVSTLVSQTWSLLYVVGRVTVYQGSIKSQAIRTFSTGSSSLTVKVQKGGRRLWENWFLHLVSYPSVLLVRRWSNLVL